MEKLYFIGISEALLKLETSGYNLHTIFFVENNELSAYCLDVNIRTKVNLKEVIKNSENISAEEIAQTVIKDSYMNLLNESVFHLMRCAKEHIAYPFTYAPEIFWNEFRKIRRDRDSFSFRKVNGYSVDGLESYEDCTEKLTEIIKNLGSETLVLAFKHSFVKMIDEMREAA